MKRAVPLVVIAALSLTVHQVSAGDAEPTPEPKKRTLLVEGAVGMGTPLGWAGISAVVLPIPALALHGGIGIGSQGPQISAGVRGRIAMKQTSHVSIGAAWSTGQFAVVGSSALPDTGYTGEPIWFWDRAHMVNVDASLEHDARAVVFRPFVGLGYVVNGGDALFTHEQANQRCPGCSPDVLARVVPYLGFAVAFGLL